MKPPVPSATQQPLRWAMEAAYGSLARLSDWDLHEAMIAAASNRNFADAMVYATVAQMRLDRAADADWLATDQGMGRAWVPSSPLSFAMQLLDPDVWVHWARHVIDQPTEVPESPVIAEPPPVTTDDIDAAFSNRKDHHMASLNKFMGIGNLTRDPEVKTLPNGTSVAGYGLAINRKYRDSQGEQREEATFIDCESFGKGADLVGQYLRKGSSVFVEGHLKLDQWEKNGEKRSKLKVVVDNFQFLDGKGGGGQQQRGPAVRNVAANDDDIPF